MALLFGGFPQQGLGKLALAQKIVNSARLSPPPSGPGAEDSVVRGVLCRPLLGPTLSLYQLLPWLEAKELHFPWPPHPSSETVVIHK